MSTITSKHIEDIAPYEGPNQIPGLRFRAAGVELGISAWGMNILDFDANCSGHPEHAHTEDRQEELYVVLKGEITLRTPDGDSHHRAGDLIRVPAQVRRQLITGDAAAVVLALGGTPGEPYKASMGG